MPEQSSSVHARRGVDARELDTIWSRIDELRHDVRSLMVQQGKTEARVVTAVEDLKALRDEGDKHHQASMKAFQSVQQSLDRQRGGIIALAAVPGVVLALTGLADMVGWV